MGSRDIKVALCVTKNDDIKNKTEKALLNAKVSYLMKCEKRAEQNIYNNEIIFYIEEQEVCRAIEAIIDMENEELDILCENKK